MTPVSLTSIDELLKLSALSGYTPVHFALDELKLLLPPPPHPGEAEGDWISIEKELGTALPSDYKDFIATYGTGAISCELWILTPFT